MNKSLEKYSIPNLNHEDIIYVNISISSMQFDKT